MTPEQIAKGLTALGERVKQAIIGNGMTCSHCKTGPWHPSHMEAYGRHYLCPNCAGA